jgi:putative ABC transport system permease protein
MNAPGVRRDSEGNIVASAEALLIVGLGKQSDGLGANVALRGVGPNAFSLRPQIELTAGRMFQRGTRELIAGKGIAAQFGGLAVGALFPALHAARGPIATALRDT